MRLASLGSGSRGNALLVEAGETRILVDAGFSARQTGGRLRSLGVDPATVRAIVLTHEHRDHTAGAGVSARRWGWPVHLSPRTMEACRKLFRGEEELRPFRPDRPFRVGDLEIRPFLTCHDAADPLAITVRDLRTRLLAGVATDLGRATVPVRHALAGCHFLVLEANHDEALLRSGPYPWPVKHRIGGSRGHLSNRLAAELAVDLLHPGLCGVLLAHLSDACNQPHLARRTVESALRAAGYRGVVEVAEQDRPSSLFDLPRLLANRGGRGQLGLFDPPPRTGEGTTSD